MEVEPKIGDRRHEHLPMTVHAAAIQHLDQNFDIAALEEVEQRRLGRLHHSELGLRHAGHVHDFVRQAPAER